MKGFAALCLLLGLAATARGETELTVAMTAGDIPITTGIPDQGSEGVRFVGYSLYDALVLFDLDLSLSLHVLSDPGSPDFSLDSSEQKLQSLADVTVG